VAVEGPAYVAETSMEGGGPWRRRDLWSAASTREVEREPKLAAAAAEEEDDEVLEPDR
jgi:hypothetical protein